MRNRLIIVLVSTISVASVNAHADKDNPAQVGARSMIGKQAPAFTLPVINKEAAGMDSVSLRQLLAKKRKQDKRVVILYFFAMWCKPCKFEMPIFSELYKDQKDKGLKVVLISVDTEKEMVEKVKGLIKDKGITCIVASDIKNDVARSYFKNGIYLPGTFVIDDRGKIIRARAGFDLKRSKALAAEIAKLL